MPLDRAHVTPAAWLMLPFGIMFFGVVGVSFMTTSFDRLVASPMLRYADEIMSIRIWGALFLGCGLLMLAARIRHRRGMYRYALLVCACAMGVWTLVAIAGIFVEPISYSAWAWPAFVGGTCISLDRSLAGGERTPRRED